MGVVSGERKRQMRYEADEYNLLEEVKKADSGDIDAMLRVGRFIAFHDPQANL